MEFYLSFDELAGKISNPVIAVLAHQRSSPNNPFVIAYEELWQTLKAAWQAGSLRGAVLRLWEPP